MDGVIVDSEPLHERAFRKVFDDIGYANTHGVDFPSYYGKSDRVVWLDFIARHQPPHTLETLLDMKERQFARLLDAERPIFQGIPQLLECSARRFMLGLASGSRHSTIDAVLSLGNYRRHFQAVVSSQDVQHGKPAPDIFLHTAGLLGVPPESCWVIEDSAAGVEAAVAAGMRVIGITNSLPAAKLSHAHHVVSSYDEVAQLLGL